MLLGFATFFTIYFKFINISGFSTALNVVRGKYDDLDHPQAGVLHGDLTPGDDIPETIRVEGEEGEVSHFQALTAALSGTVGLGKYSRSCHSNHHWWSWSNTLDDYCRSSRNDIKIC